MYCVTHSMYSIPPFYINININIFKTKTKIGRMETRKQHRKSLSPGVLPSPCASEREAAVNYHASSSGGAAATDDHRPRAAPAGVAVGHRPPRKTILSQLREAQAYLPAPSPSLPKKPTQFPQGAPHVHDRRRRASISAGRLAKSLPMVLFNPRSLVTPQGRARAVPQRKQQLRYNIGGYRISDQGRLEFDRIKDEVRFASVTAAVRSVLDHHRELLHSIAGGAPVLQAAKSFVAVVCRDTAQAGGYRLCIRCFGSHLPPAVPWMIDALVRGETLVRGVREILQIGTMSPTSALGSLPTIWSQCRWEAGSAWCSGLYCTHWRVAILFAHRSWLVGRREGSYAHPADDSRAGRR